MAIFAGSANIVWEPELKFNNDGTAYCRLRLANQERTYDKESGKWVKDEPIFFSMTVYKKLAENLAESVMAGDRLIVVGKFRLEKYTDKEGVQREDLKLIPHEVGADLRFHRAVVEKDDDESEREYEETPSFKPPF
jgi:single stranded DNA-binding protein (ssb)